MRRLHKRRVERAHVPRLRRRAKLFGTCNHGKLQVDEHRAFVHFQDLRSMRTRASARVQELAAPRLNGVGAANLRRKPAKVLARVRLEACRSVEHPCCLIDATAWSCRQQRHAVSRHAVRAELATERWRSAERARPRAARVIFRQIDRFCK